MALEKLNEEIHSREYTREVPRSRFEPGVAEDAAQSAAFAEDETWKSNAPSAAEITFRQAARKRKMAWILGGLAALFLIGGVVFRVRAMLFSENNLDLTVTGPRQVKSGEEVSLVAFIENKNWSDLTNATLIVAFPRSFQPVSDSRAQVSNRRMEIALTDIKKRSDVRVPIDGVFYGSRGEDTDFTLTLRYTPESVSGQYEAETTFGVQVATSVVALDLIAPLETASDTDMEYVVDYGNDGATPVTSLRVRFEYPEGFAFVSAEPQPVGGDREFVIGTLAPGARGKIIVRGRITGNQQEAKKVSASIGYVDGVGGFIAYNGSERTTRLVASPLVVTQQVNKGQTTNADAGEILDYVVKFRNNGNVGLRDVVLTVRLDSPLLDYSRLRHRDGAFNAGQKVLTWRAADLPALARLNPGEGGVVEFSVPVLNPLPENIGGGNYAVETVAKIDSPDIPNQLGTNRIIASNTVTIRVNSTILFVVRIDRNDTELPMSGPIPPIAGVETVYTLRVSLFNAYNDLIDGAVRLTLPSGTLYSGEKRPDGEIIDFNERANEITWRLGTIRPDRVGERILRLRVKATPEVARAQEDLELVSAAVFTAKDSYTGEERRIESKLRDYLAQDRISLKIQDPQ